MDAFELQEAFGDLTTTQVTDACRRLEIAVRCAPYDIRPLQETATVVGAARPAQHCGSVDVLLEAVERSQPGDVLVVDNAGRPDEACIGGLVALEAARADLTGIIIWGLHRDTAALRDIGLPIFSQGALPAGPRLIRDRPDAALDFASCGQHIVSTQDCVLGDDDGVVFFPHDRSADIAQMAVDIRATERDQATRMRLGHTLRNQTRFAEYIANRTLGCEPTITFRQHLRSINCAVEP